MSPEVEAASVDLYPRDNLIQLTLRTTNGNRYVFAVPPATASTLASDLSLAAHGEVPTHGE